jgi:hypothetical protein
MPVVRRAFAGPPPGAELSPSRYVPSDAVLDGDPQEHEHLYFTSPDGTYTVGVWQAQPYSEQVAAYPGDEFCHVIRGQVTLVDTDGFEQTFAEGDSFVVEAGWQGVWRVDRPFLKYFALCTRPQPPEPS